MGFLRWQDIKECFVVKILELNFKELVRVKPVYRVGGQVKVRKWFECECKVQRSAHSSFQCAWNVWEVAEDDTENIGEKGHWIAFEGRIWRATRWYELEKDITGLLWKQLVVERSFNREISRAWWVWKNTIERYLRSKVNGKLHPIEFETERGKCWGQFQDWGFWGTDHESDYDPVHQLRNTFPKKWEEICTLARDLGLGAYKHVIDGRGCD